ncbi:hypothetical protein CVH10_21955, partial [Halomonas sp. ND22Bw]|uniref:hypothetical protein n=1 Tax=Halomonas sp. ND22Bw TaxID=2054178 RepID=UPI000D266AB9
GVVLTRHDPEVAPLVAQVALVDGFGEQFGALPCASRDGDFGGSGLLELPALTLAPGISAPSARISCRVVDVLRAMDGWGDFSGR